MSGTIAPVISNGAGEPTSFALTVMTPTVPIQTPVALISNAANGNRRLEIGWTFIDGDASAPPSAGDFEVTVTDASGRVTGHLALTDQYTWVPAMVCEETGHWNGPILSTDGGVD